MSHILHPPSYSLCGSSFVQILTCSKTVALKVMDNMVPSRNSRPLIRQDISIIVGEIIVKKVIV